MARIAFATCRRFERGAPDDAPALAALRARGHQVSLRVWNQDPGVDADLVVLRSCWDYHLEPARFREWVRSLGARVVNPARTVLWNLDKRYLETLGVPIPKTAFLDRSAGSLGSELEQLGVDEAVVKPLVSMGGWETWRTNRARAAADEPRFRALVSEREVMLQAFVPAVLGDGETSLVYFAGELSHALVKLPAAGEFRIHAEHGGRTRACEPGPTLRAAAERVLAAAPEPLPYARVDLIPAPDGPLLMELEAIDPELFFRFAAGAAERFAVALEARLGNG